MTQEFGNERSTSNTPRGQLYSVPGIPGPETNEELLHDADLTSNRNFPAMEMS